MTLLVPEEVGSVVKVKCSSYVATSLEHVVRVVDHVYTLLNTDLQNVTLQFEQLALESECEDAPKSTLKTQLIAFIERTVERWFPGHSQPNSEHDIRL